jgi:PAS domain S-box-containing protein
MAEALVENSPRGIHFYELDGEDRLVFSGYNPGADTMLGVDHSAFLGKTIEEAFPALASTEVPRRYLEAARDRKHWSTEQIAYSDGRIQGAFGVIAFPTKPRAMAAVFSDITLEKRAEEELKRQQSFTAAVLESLPGIFYLYDYPGLRLKDWNKNHETAFGFTAEEIRGRHISEWHIPEMREPIKAAVEAVMARGSNTAEAPLVSKDGSRKPYLLTGTRLEADGQTYLMGVGIDISERVAAEEKLRLLNQELEDRVADRTMLLSSANDALGTALRELRESQEKMLLKEKMAALGQLVAGLAHELNTPLGAILSASATSGAAVGALLDAMRLYRSLDLEEERVFAALSSGIGREESRDREEERQHRRRYREILEAAGLAKPILLAEELADLGYAGTETELVALCRLPRLGQIAEAAHLLNSIARSDYVIGMAADKAARVVLALKTYSRREPSEEMILSDLREQLETVLVILENRMKKGIEVFRDFGDLPPLPCHPDRLAQVWMNLITNAIQAMEYKGRLEIAAKALPGAIEVSVTDDGPGIPEAIRDRVFEPFFTTKIAGEGSGLGLDICRRILDEMGATIAFESRPGRTRFSVSLPLGEGVRARA